MKMHFKEKKVRNFRKSKFVSTIVLPSFYFKQKLVLSLSFLVLFIKIPEVWSVVVLLVSLKSEL